MSDLLEDIYELLAFFLSSQRISELEPSPLYGQKDPLHGFEHLQRDLITKRLIGVAITVRILDDRNPKLFDMLTDYCGVMTKNLDNPTQTDGLGIRDACNKVIHARKVNFDLGIASNGKNFFHPFVYIEGTERRKPWSVQLDVVKFCRECAAALDLTQE